MVFDMSVDMYMCFLPVLGSGSSPCLTISPMIWPTRRSRSAPTLGVGRLEFGDLAENSLRSVVIFLTLTVPPPSLNTVSA